jgi:choloylglycine hydrolase
MLSLTLLLLITFSGATKACTDFYMNFTEHRISGRTMDLGAGSNWTITAWPRSFPNDPVSKFQPPSVFWPAMYATIGITGNWFGDEKYGFPSLFADSLNEKGVSCSLLMLVNSQYAKRDENKINVLNGVFCHYVTQNFASVDELQAALPNIVIWGPDLANQHFIVHDSSGTSLIIECVNGEQKVYVDSNDGKLTFGIMTNEPTFDWHLENIRHYEWKRTLARQAVAIPGNFYPEERFLRVHMIKSGMEDKGYMSEKTFQRAFSLTSEVSYSTIGRKYISYILFSRF